MTSTVILDNEHTDECSPVDDSTSLAVLDCSCEGDGDDNIEAPPFSPISSAESTDSEPTIRLENETESDSWTELVGICISLQNNIIIY